MRTPSKTGRVLKYIFVCTIALCLNGGTIAQQDQSLAHWQSLVEQNPDDALAWFNIGVLYETGQDGEKNQTKAHDAYKKAIDLNYAPAMYNLGSIYAKQKDYANARLWWEKAAELNLPEAQYNMGMLYEKGWGVNVDPQISSSWYQRAAETAMEKYFQLYQKSRSEHPASPVTDDSSLSIFNRLLFINSASAAAPEFDLSELQLAQADTQTQDSNRQSQSDEPARPPDWDWVYSQPGDNFTIQLFATKDPAKTEKFIQQYALSEGARVIKAVVKGTTYYKVLIGSFAEWNDAAVEIGTFPQDLRNQRPWVRKFVTLYKELPEDAAVAKTSQPETQQSDNETADTSQAQSDDKSEPPSADSQTQTAAVDENATDNQVKVESLPEKVEESADSEEDVAAEPIQPNPETAGDAPAEEEESQLTAQDESQQAQAPQGQSTQPEIVEPTEAVSSELPQTGDVFTIFAKKQLASDGLSQDIKARLKSGLDAIASGDHDSGFKLLSGLADTGLSEAQYRVALLYSQGKGVGKDDVRAFDLMKAASEQGHPYAQQALADFYTNGIGVDANTSLAAYWQQTADDNVEKLENQ